MIETITELAQLLQLRLVLHSRPGRGSVFTLRLPAEPFAG